MPSVRLRDLSRLSADARRQIRAAINSNGDGHHPSKTVVEDVSPSPSKLHNVRTSVDGYTFDSVSEARRYGELKIEALAGSISDLDVHQRFSLDVNGVHICDYEADFTYRRNGRFVVEDVKSTATVTRLYRVKKKLMLAVLGITIQEVYGS